MINALKQARCTVKGKVLLTVGAIAGAVALPQVVHLIGAAAGVGTALGELLLPMHFFVLLAGLFGNGSLRTADQYASFGNAEGNSLAFYDDRVDWLRSDCRLGA